MHVESQSGRAGAGGTSIFQYDYECICKHKISAHGQWLPETVHVFNLGFAPLWSIDWQFISAACGYVLIGVTLIAGVNTSMTTGKGRMATIPDFEMKVESLSQHMSWHRYCHDEPCWQCVSSLQHKKTCSTQHDGGSLCQPGLFKLSSITEWQWSTLAKVKFTWGFGQSCYTNNNLLAFIMIIAIIVTTCIYCALF